MPNRTASFISSLCVAALLAVALYAGPANALHRETPGAVRLTFGGPQTIPETRSWGNFFAFASTTDLLGNGSVGQHVFIFNLAYFDCNNHTTRPRTPCPDPPLPALVQLEHRPGSPSNPSVTTDGKWVAFEADGAFNGTTGPEARRRQIFLMSPETGEILQITRSPEHDSIRPSLNRGGSIVVFESRAPLGGRTDLAGIPQIFAYHRLTRLFAQISTGRGPSRSPMPNSGGSRVSFESTAALLGDGHDTGIAQVFVSFLDVNSFTSTLVQITKGNRPSVNPYIAEKGVDLVVFESTATDLQGSDGDGTPQVYMAPTGEGNLPILAALTNRADYGDCHGPALDITGTHVAFVCTGDPLENGTTGNRIFSIDLAADPADPTTPRLYQLTGRGDPQGRLRHNVGQWFATFVDRVDRTASGACDYQLQMIDYYPGRWNAATQKGSLPPDLLPPNPFPTPESNVIGARTFAFAPGDAAGGSQLRVSSQSGSEAGGPIGRGQVGISIGPQAIDGVAPIQVPSLATSTSLPPIPVTGLGTICLALTGDGSGTIDCDGGTVGGDIETQQDHDIGDVNPGCVAGCFERGACQGPLPGPHRGACNSEVTFTHTGTYAPGGTTLRLPLAVGIATDAGVDGFWCTDDDSYTFRDLPSWIELTTGTNTSSILDADNTAGVTLGTVDHGVALDCARLEAQDLTGAELVGALPILDVPTRDGVRDLLVRLRLQARPPLQAPQVCRAAPCTTDNDCNDANLCNGVETCVGRTCAPGTPIVCDDGDACNGAETCNPRTGECLDGRTLDCNDNNVCTDEHCNPAVGCVHSENDRSCDDEDACTQGDTCRGGSCQGTPFMQCDDGNACNGAETCDPESGECVDGSTLSCNDGNPCTNDSCSPTLGCLHTSNTAPCNDQNKCTANDVCGNGTCTGTLAVLCDDGNACNGAESCNPSTGSCVSGHSPDCDDDNPCTGDTCAAGTGCVHSATTGPCDDGNTCTVNDVCQNGTCRGDAAAACDDGDPCNGVETCNARTGECDRGARLACSDGDACTIDRCDAATGDPAKGFCLHEPNETRRGCDPVERIRKKLKEIKTIIKETADDQLGGARSKKRLERQAVKTQSALTGADTASMRKTIKRLKPFQSTVLQMKRKNKIDPAVAEKLMTLSNEAMRMLEAQ